MFDWKKFHKDLDYAIASWIESNDDNLPSKKSLMNFMEFSNKKQLNQSAE